MAQKKKSTKPGQAIASALSGAFSSGLDTLSGIAQTAPARAGVMAGLPRQAPSFEQALASSGLGGTRIPSALGNVTPQQRQQIMGAETSRLQRRQDVIDTPRMSGAPGFEMEGGNPDLIPALFDFGSRVTAMSGIGDVIGAADANIVQPVNRQVTDRMKQSAAPQRDWNYVPSEELGLPSGSQFGPAGVAALQRELQRGNTLNADNTSRLAQQEAQRRFDLQQEQRKAEYDQAMPLANSPTMAQAAASQGGGAGAQFTAEMLSLGLPGEFAQAGRTVRAGLAGSARGIQRGAARTGNFIQDLMNSAVEAGPRSMGGAAARDIMPGMNRGVTGNVGRTPPSSSIVMGQLGDGYSVTPNTGLTKSMGRVSQGNTSGQVIQPPPTAPLTDDDLARSAIQTSSGLSQGTPGYMRDADLMEVVPGWSPPPTTSTAGYLDATRIDGRRYPRPATRVIQGQPMMPSTGRLNQAPTGELAPPPGMEQPGMMPTTGRITQPFQQAAPQSPAQMMQPRVGPMEQAPPPVAQNTDLQGRLTQSEPHGSYPGTRISENWTPQQPLQPPPPDTLGIPTQYTDLAMGQRHQIQARELGQEVALQNAFQAEQRANVPPIVEPPQITEIVRQQRLAAEAAAMRQDQALQAAFGNEAQANIDNALAADRAASQDARLQEAFGRENEWAWNDAADDVANNAQVDNFQAALQRTFAQENDLRFSQQADQAMRQNNETYFANQAQQPPTPRNDTMGWTPPETPDIVPPGFAARQAEQRLTQSVTSSPGEAVAKIRQLLQQGGDVDQVIKTLQDNPQILKQVIGEVVADAAPKLPQAAQTATETLPERQPRQPRGGRAARIARNEAAAALRGGSERSSPFESPGVGGQVDAAPSSGPRDSEVQYAGGVGARQERVVNSTAPGGAGPADDVSAADDVAAPAQPNLPHGPALPRTGTKTVSPQEILRQAREVSGLIARNETSPPNILEKARRAISGTDNTRLVYTDRGVGAFHGKRGIIEVRKPNERGAETAYHEVGHSLGRNSNFLDGVTPEMTAELERLGTPNDPAVPTKTGIGSSWTPSDSIEYKRGEGMAEFARLWAQFPEQARILAPALSARMDRYLAESGQIGQKLKQWQEAIQSRETATFAALRDAQQIREDRMKTIEAVSTEDGRIQQLFDRFHPFRRMEAVLEKAGRQLRPFERPHALASTVRARATGQTAEEVAKLGEILRGINGEEELRQFEQYLNARHFKTMKSKGMATGYSQEMIDDAIDTAKPDWNAKAQAIYALQEEQLQEGVRLGMWDQAHVDELRDQWPEYVPSNRFFELGAEELPVKAGAGGGAQRAGASLQHSNPLMKLHGSERELLSPITGIIRNTANIRLQALKNQLGTVIAKLWDEHADSIGDYIMKVDPPEGGADLAANNLFRVRRNGVDEYYQVSPQLYRSITDETSLSEDPFSTLNQLWGDILRPMATTYNPGFALANIVRDTLTIPYVTRVGGKTRIPGFPFITGAAEQLKAARGNPEAQARIAGFKRQGGYQDFSDSLVERPNATVKAKSLVTDPVGTAKDRTVGAAIGSGIGFGLGGLPGAAVGGAIGGKVGFTRAKRALGAVTEFGEQSNRVGHFLEARKYHQSRNPDWDDDELDFIAGFEARDVQDFSRRGSNPSVRWVRRNVPFVGATTEGTRRSVEAVLTRPLQVLATGLALGVAPEAIETFWWRDDPDYWNIPQEKRDRYFYLPNPAWDGTDIENKFIPLPKGQGIFLLPANATQWTYQKATDTHAPSAGEMASSVIRSATPADIDPTQWTSPGNTAANLMGLAGPVGNIAGELASGRDFFRRRDIVPGSVKKKHPSPVMQSGTNTSATATAIAQALHKSTGGRINTSPMEIDHLLYRLFAGTGQNVINAVIDPGIDRVSRYLNPDEPKITQPEGRKAKSLGAMVVDAARLRYVPSRIDSVNRLEDRVTELKVLQDEGTIDPADAAGLADMELDLGEVRGLLEELRGAKSSDARRSIVNNIYELSEPWSRRR